MLKEYILRIRLSGMKNIKDSVELNFYNKTIDKILDIKNTNIKAIYGANGVGKSAIMNAIEIYKNIIIKENYLRNDSTQVYLTELINKESEIFSIEIAYAVYDGENMQIMNIYSHSLILAMNNAEYYIKSEKIIEHKGRNLDKGNQRVIIDIQKGEITSSITDDVSNVVKVSTNLLKETSIVQIIMNELWKSNLKKGVKLFGKDIAEASLHCYFMGFSIRVVLANEDTHIDFLKNSINRGSMKNIIDLSSNVNINDEIPRIMLSSRDDLIMKEDVTKYNKEIAELSKFIRLFKPSLKKIEIEKKENGNVIRCSKYFNYGKYKVWSDFESTGIKKLISLYTALKAFNVGGIVFIDELDSNLHDVYLCKMLEYFSMYGKGQLCFTTHNLGPMEILSSKKHSIDFLSDNNEIVSWIKQGNYSVKNMYKSGMIDNSPFNVEPFDFLGIFGGD